MSTSNCCDQPGTRVIELDIEGMTCASCVSRVERKLGKLDGVSASVNLPLESAHVTVPGGITDEQITATVEAAGYKAKVRPPATQPRRLIRRRSARLIPPADRSVAAGHRCAR